MRHIRPFKAAGLAIKYTNKSIRKLGQGRSLLKLMEGFPALGKEESHGKST